MLVCPRVRVCMCVCMHACMSVGASGCVLCAYACVHTLCWGTLYSEIRRCVKVEVAVLGTPILIVCTISVSVKQHRTELLLCFTVIETSRQLRGNGYLSYTSLAQRSVRFPWHNGMAFRTRAQGGTLMQIILDSGQVRIQVSLEPRWLLVCLLCVVWKRSPGGM